MKTISFVVPVYNDGDSIEKMIRSVRDQDLSDIEVVAVNDGSTDNSKQVLDNLKEQGLIDTLIHLETNEGACVARNKGAKVATGKYLSFLPADAILYPGMARIWYNTLEENPDYDFVYGGYRFIDEEGEPLPGQDYLFNPFDPYLLDVTNYIDGSFPIKTEAFWKYAKLMGQEDGLWDKNIKSLQDWDFWLSVVKNGGKGVYIQDIFFGTTMPHAGGLSVDSSNNWLERTEAIKAKHKIPMRKTCVTSLGAGFHAKRMAYLLNADFKQMPSNKPHRYDAIYSIGFYVQFGANQDAIFLNNFFNPSEGRTAAKKIVHFVGSDVWELYHVSTINLRTQLIPYFKNIDVVLCESDFIQSELKELGIEAQIVPLPPAKLYEIKPLPEEFTIAVYMPMVNAEFYRPNEMVEIAKNMPDVKFKFFGNPTKIGNDPAWGANVDNMGYLDAEGMEKLIYESSAIIRFPIHDGLPITVLEFVLAGRYALCNVPIRHTLCLPNLTVDECVKGIRQMQEMAKQGVNQIASDYWRAELDHNKYRETMHKLCTYEPKEYWENRAKSWSDQAQRMPVESEEIKKVFEKIGSKSVLDIGCGDGRWYPILKEWGVQEYMGIDISENLIKAAQFRFPAIKESFSAMRVEELGTKEQVDLVFSYTCLEHITEEEFPKAVEAIKKAGKWALLVEPINFTSRYYCHTHDYKKHFNVVEEVPLKDKVIYLCQNSPTEEDSKTLTK